MLGEVVVVGILVLSGDEGGALSTLWRRAEERGLYFVIEGGRRSKGVLQEGG